MEQTSIKTKIGVHEFEATGQKDTVDAQYKAWLAAISALPQSVISPAVPTPSAPADPAAPKPLSGNGGEASTTGLPTSMLDRVFRKDDGGLSLAALPRGDNAAPDAILALLYGALKIKGEATVTGTALMRGVRISGVPDFGRMDRLMDSMSDLILAAGIRKARRYQLNNRGIAKAEEIIKSILQ